MFFQGDKMVTLKGSRTVTFTKTSIVSAFTTVKILPELRISCMDHGHFSLRVEEARKFGRDLHRWVDDYVEESEMCDGDFDFEIACVGLSSLILLADFALEGAFDASW